MIGSLRGRAGTTIGMDQSTLTAAKVRSRLVDGFFPFADTREHRLDCLCILCEKLGILEPPRAQTKQVVSDLRNI